MKITKEEFIKARNNSYEAMIYCQYLIDSATTETEKILQDVCIMHIGACTSC